jgi:GAF domain-containing protein
MIFSYDDLLSDIQGLFEGERDPIANAANAAAAIWQHLPDINWAGFYFLRRGALVLGPFQGKPACVRIAIGAGVCGAAAARRQTVVVRDVHEFPGHIACDAASNSEIVAPLIRNRRLLGVLDIDSPSLNRFAEPDRIGCEAIAALYVRSLDA